MMHLVTPDLRNRLANACRDPESKLSSYEKKKYVLKLLYIYILGWEVDFGHVEALALVTGNKFSEKQIVRGTFNRDGGM